MANFEGGTNIKRAWVIKCDGEEFTSYDTEAQAKAYVNMQMEKAKCCPKKEQTYAVQRRWTIEHRG